MPEEKTRSTGLQWGINLDWFPASGRSAQTLLSSYLCRRCAESLGAKKETRPQALLTAIQGCCAQDPDFISDKMPILESVFRFFLKNGNRPLTLSELSNEIGRVLPGDIYRTSPEMLGRLLKDDRYYGLQKITG